MQQKVFIGGVWAVWQFFKSTSLIKSWIQHWFRVSANTLMKSYKDVLFFLFFSDSNIPSAWNNANVTQEELTAYLTNLRNIQSEGIQYIQNRLRTPNGKPVTMLNIDATHVNVDKSLDAYAQMQSYSGRSQKGHCLLFSNITCPMGTVVARL